MSSLVVNGPGMGCGQAGGFSHSVQGHRLVEGRGSIERTSESSGSSALKEAMVASLEGGLKRAAPLAAAGSRADGRPESDVANYSNCDGR